MCSQWDETATKDRAATDKKRYDDEKKIYDDAKKKYDEHTAKEDATKLLIEKPSEPEKPTELKKKKVCQYF